MSRMHLLDTHMAVELAGTSGFEGFPRKVQRILNDANNVLCMSAISEVEIAQKFRQGKLDLRRDELIRICQGASIELRAFRSHHAQLLYDLPMHHKDPFDRMIIAQAMADGLPLISKNEQFRFYDGLEVIWR